MHGMHFAPTLKACARAIAAAIAVALTAAPGEAQISDGTRTHILDALREFDRVCAAPSSMLWRVSLCGPVVVVDATTRVTISNQAPATGTFASEHGAFIGTLPDDVEIANTALEWAGSRWTMLRLPLPRADRDRMRLMVHEAFHRIQPSLGVAAANVVIPQLEERNARYWVRLELRALRDVQRDTDRARARLAAADALLFAAARHRQFPGTDTLEAMLELNEGLAEYTGIVVASRAYGENMYSATDRARRNLEALPTFVRSYAYGMGPGLGLALDRFAPGWRERVSSIRSLSVELKHAIAWTQPRELVDSALARAAFYDTDSIAISEDRRAAERTKQLEAYRARLLDGPVVVFRQKGVGGAFNPNTIVPLEGVGLIYPQRTVTAEWGELTVDRGGMLVSTDRTTLRVTAEGIRIDAASGTASGDGWTLRLAAGWNVRSGGRTGDYEVVR